MTAGPPLSDGAFHERFNCVGEAEVAIRLVGGFGTAFIVCDEVTSLDGLLVPAEFIAETL